MPPDCFAREKKICSPGRKRFFAPQVGCLALLGVVVFSGSPLQSGGSALKRQKNPKGDDELLCSAFSAVAKRDIYQNPVIVQSFYSQKTELSFIFFPRISEEDKKPDRPELNWKIVVTFEGPLQAPKLAFTNEQNIPTNHRADGLVRGKVVEKTSFYASAKGILKLPCVVSFASDEIKYRVLYTRVPARPGGVFRIDLSRDMKGLEINP